MTRAICFILNWMEYKQCRTLDKKKMYLFIFFTKTYLTIGRGKIRIRTSLVAVQPNWLITTKEQLKSERP